MCTGSRLFEKSMKTFLIILLAFSLLLLGSCEKKAEEAAPANNQKPEETAEAAPANNRKPEETAAPVQELPSGVGTALDKTFTAGQIVFEQTDLRLPDLKTCEFILPPDSFWETYQQTRPTVDEFRSKMADSELIVFSYSPDGSTGIGWLADAPVAFTGNSITLLYPTKERGVEDRYDMLQSVYETFSQRKNGFGTGREGITWSPKGHYFCAMNYLRMWRDNRAKYGSPVIADTRTGEIFCVDSFSPELASDNREYGMWYSGCFSENEQSFYAFYYGRRYGRNMLLRYGLNDSTCTALESPFDTAGDYYAYPGISVSSDETLTALTAPVASTRNQAILQIGADRTPRRIPLSLFDEISQQLFTHASRMFASGASGEALILFETQPTGAVPLFRESLMHIRTADPEQGMDTVWVIRDNPLRLEAWTSAELRTMAGAEPEELQKTIREYMRIFDAVLSPDGRYAAVLTGNQYSNKAALLIIRLEDMAALPGEAALLELLSYRDINRYATMNQYLLNWSEAGLLVVPGSMMFQIHTD